MDIKDEEYRKIHNRILLCNNDIKSIQQFLEIFERTGKTNYLYSCCRLKQKITTDLISIEQALSTINHRYGSNTMIAKEKTSRFKKIKAVAEHTFMSLDKVLEKRPDSSHNGDGEK